VKRAMLVMLVVLVVTGCAVLGSIRLVTNTGDFAPTFGRKRKGHGRVVARGKGRGIIPDGPGGLPSHRIEPLRCW
jgi:hypothetical protein